MTPRLWSRRVYNPFLRSSAHVTDQVCDSQTGRTTLVNRLNTILIFSNVYSHDTLALPHTKNSRVNLVWQQNPTI